MPQRTKTPFKWIWDDIHEEKNDHSNIIENNESDKMDKIENSSQLNVEVGQETRGMERIDEFLMRDFEEQGYMDALENADSKYMSENVELILYELQILLDSEERYLMEKSEYMKLEREKFNEMGMIDSVNRIDTKIGICQSHQTEIKVIGQELESKEGKSQRVIISYIRGFKRGIASASQTSFYE